MAPEGLSTISKSLLTWPNIHQLSLASWHLWMNTICTLFTGVMCNTKLTHPLGAWTANYQNQQHWHWCLASTGRLLHQPTLTNQLCAAILAQQNQTQLIFSPMIPTNQQFTGPPVTPMDPYQHTVLHPVPPLPPLSPGTTPPLFYQLLIIQFWTMLVQWN